MKCKEIADILFALNDECGRLNNMDWATNKDRLVVVLAAYKAIGKIRAEDIDLDRMDRFNGAGGALSWGGRSFACHQDRCTCQGDDPTPHRHYGYAPYTCARCAACESYSPVPITSAVA